ncbi:MAG: flagellar protein FliT [Piscirickettsiaceae bacterium]|nr:flagellar protein FliT [Piscirickettsiaceae bacterium]
MSSILNSVLDGITKSKQLLGLAEAGEWEQFLELEEQRQATLSILTLDNLDLTQQRYDEIKEQMTQLIELNEQLETVCQQQRSFLVKELKKLSKGTQAKKAYSQVK